LPRKSLYFRPAKDRESKTSLVASQGHLNQVSVEERAQNVLQLLLFEVA